MFEFLEKCDRQLFNNTLELESQMRTRYAFVSMRKICEYILKEMYDDFQKNHAIDGCQNSINITS